MNLSTNTTRYILIAVAAFVVAVFIFGYIAIPFSPHAKGMNDFRQLLGPLDLENMEAGAVLQVVVDSAPGPLRVRICRDLARKRISIKTTQPQTIRHVLGDVAVQLQTGIGDEAAPHFRCRRFFDDSILIEKRRQ
jgi:hypothetical protein